MRQLLSLILTLLFAASLHAQDSNIAARRDSVDKAAADSSFITVSLLKATPGKEPYSILGHSFLRLQSPSNKLDIAYSFAMDITPGDMVKFFFGKAKSGFLYAPTTRIIGQYRQEGRGVTEIRLNLNPRQKQMLWQYLDHQMAEGTQYSFDYLHTNCASMTANSVENILNGETIVYNNLPQTLHYAGSNYRKSLTPMFENYPWYLLFWNITLGEHNDKPDITYGRIFPQYLWDTWRNAQLRDQRGNLRPMTVGNAVTLSQVRGSDKPFPISPMMAFGAIMLLALISLFVADTAAGKLLCHIMDIILMTIQTIIGVWICFLLTCSDLAATDWNWLVGVFNPLPLLAWIAARRKTSVRFVYLACAIVPLAYTALTPLLTQVQACPNLICLFLAFSLRAYGNYRTCTRNNV